MMPHENTVLPPSDPTQQSTHRRRVRYVLLAFSTILVAACSLKEPLLPTWGVPVNVPIATEIFRVGEEIVDDSTVVVDGPDSLIYISISGELENVELDAGEFNMEGFDTTTVFELGEIELDSLGSIDTGPMTLREIFPLLEEFVIDGQGTVFMMPETSFAPEAPEMNSDDFSTLHLVDGTFELAFENNMPFPVGPNSTSPNGIEIVIYDGTDTQIIAVNIDQVVQPGESASASTPVDPGGVWVVAPLRADYIMPVAEETTFPLDDEVLDTTGVRISLGFEGLLAHEAVAMIEPQVIEALFEIAIDNENRIREALIEEGAINMSFENNTALNANVGFTIHSLITTGNEQFADQITLPPNSSYDYVIDIADMRIVHPAGNGNFVDDLEILYEVVTDETSEMTHISATDFVSVDVEVGYLTFQSFSGWLAERVFDIDPIEESDLADYTNFPDNIELEAVDLALNLSSELFIENMGFNLTLTGYHQDGNGYITDSAMVQVVNQPINSGVPGNPGLTSILLNGPEVAELLNILPTSIRTYGNVVASGEVAITANSQVSGDYALSTPLKLRVNGEAIIEGEEQLLTDEDIDEDLQKAADENLEEAQLVLQFSNHTPFGGMVRLIVSADPARENIYDNSYLNPEREFVKEITIDAAPVNELTGYVDSPHISPVEINLTREEFQVFNDPPIRIGFEIRIAGTDEYVAIRASDYIQISGLARVVVIVEN